jgi:large subunit ribosomal protein L3
MTIGVVGKKCGMTRVFQEDGSSVPVTVIDVNGNRVTQLRSAGKDGYRAVQVTYGERRPALLNKSEAGQFAKAGVSPGLGLWEFRLGEDEAEAVAPGAEVGADVFSAGDKVDVTGISKGKGFAGGVKRWNFSMQDATHGNSLSHRAPGSTGQNQTPGRVFKGKKMAGQMGTVRRTQQNLQIMRVDLDRNLLLIKGSVPGAPGGHVMVRSAVKSEYRDFAWRREDVVAADAEAHAATNDDIEVVSEVSDTGKDI